VQENIPVTGDIITLNENMLNYGLWKIPENEIFIKIGDTVINCNPDETFSDNNLSCVLAKNSVIDTVACETASIPSVDKVFINRGLTLEKTEISENGEEIVTILEDQQLVGHEYGAGAANSSADRRQYNWAAENIITSIVTFASKLSVFLSTIETINKFTMLGIATGAGLAVLT
jgi:hypothetical protein